MAINLEKITFFLFNPAMPIRFVCSCYALWCKSVYNGAKLSQADFDNMSIEAKAGLLINNQNQFKGK
jgi:hypothetical protein